MRSIVLRLLVTALVLTLVGCGGLRGASPAPTSTELTIFGAASLRTALEQAKVAYEAEHPGTILTVGTDSSAALATQIEQGAPADVFLSADASNPQRLVDAGLAEGMPVAFAANSLTIVVPLGNPGAVVTWRDLARDGLRIIGAGDEVPITRYTDALVDELASLGGAPAGFAARVRANLVSREDNVRAILAKIELGEGDAAIVYVTDARPSPGVRTVEVPDEANLSAVYTGVVLAESANPPAARGFLEWWIGPDGQAILGALGFEAPPA